MPALNLAPLFRSIALSCPGGCRRALRVLLGGVLLGLVGCAATGEQSSRRNEAAAGGIEELHLFGVPVAINFAQLDRPDGFAVRVYASSRSRARGVPIRRGTLEIVMFDGTVTAEGARAATPAKVWTYPAASLAGFETVNSLGVGYQFGLRWEGARPVKNHLTVVARYSAGEGMRLESAPSVIPVVVK